MHTKHGLCRAGCARLSITLLVQARKAADKTHQHQVFKHTFGANKEKPVAQVKQVSWLSHRLRNNMGSHDRFLRSLLGAALVLVAWLFQLPEAFWLGLYLILTAALRFCPNYAIFNVDTLSAGEQKNSIPWAELLELLPPTDSATPAETSAKPLATAASNTVVAAKPAAFSLPPELSHALLHDIERNAIDEILMVRFYENFFGCRIKIEQAAHLNIYVCQFSSHTSRLDFAKLKSQLLQRVQETAS